MLRDVEIAAAHFKLKPAELHACLLSAYLHPFRAQRCYRAIAASLAPQNPAEAAAKPGLACPAPAFEPIASTDRLIAALGAVLRPDALDEFAGTRYLTLPGEGPEGRGR